MAFYPQEFILKYTITSSDITTAAKNLTVPANAGDLLIKNVIVKSDSTGLAGGTNFQLLTNNAKGQANFFVTSVASLGANQTVDFSTATVTHEQTVLESGKVIQYSNTAAVGTGAGTIDIYLVLQRATVNATINN